MHELNLVDVQKRYREKDAVRGFTFTFTNGVYGLLGENGAGKTTLMRLICGILQPTNGSITCDNIRISDMGAEYRRLLGYLPQDFGYYGDFTAVRFLNYMAALKALPREYAKGRVEKLLELVDLKDVKNKKLKTYSGGMLRRIGIAQALLNEADILILDEPTAGLDPKERVRFRNIISSLGKNRIVLLSTHIVSDIEYIATRNAIMKAGHIIDVGTTDELVKQIEGKVWNCTVPAEKLPEYELRLRIINQRGEDNNQVSIRYLADQAELDGAVPVSPRLEDLYLWLFPQTDLEKEDR